ncbi:MAG: hypothetical protein R2747_00235 [Pyrinomonadaceae bacterium]
MTEQEKTKSIWKTIKGSKELFALYGYFPTLHDASLTDFDVDLENRQVVLTCEYCDLIGEDAEIDSDDEELATRITIRWNLVSEVRLQMRDNDIYHLGFQRTDGKIRTLFRRSSGIGGFIISESVEVVSVELSQLESSTVTNEFLNTVNFSFS